MNDRNPVTCMVVAYISSGLSKDDSQVKSGRGALTNYVASSALLFFDKFGVLPSLR